MIRKGIPAHQTTGKLRVCQYTYWLLFLRSQDMHVCMYCTVQYMYMYVTIYMLYIHLYQHASIHIHVHVFVWCKFLHILWCMTNEIGMQSQAFFLCTIPGVVYHLPFTPHVSFTPQPLFHVRPPYLILQPCLCIVLYQYIEYWHICAHTYHWELHSHILSLLSSILLQ